MLTSRIDQTKRVVTLRFAEDALRRSDRLRALLSLVEHAPILAVGEG